MLIRISYTMFTQVGTPLLRRPFYTLDEYIVPKILIL